ncbi:MAG: gluconate 2-dehydrogenase subunit 3 family protein [Pseudomonadota bacterium]
MRTLDKRVAVGRRKFLGASAGAALLAGLTGEIDAAQALAATLRTVSSAEAAATLLKMARDIYPHDRVPDAYYAAAIASIDASLAAEPGGGALLSDGIAALDTAARARFGSAYVAVAQEPDRVALLHAMETTPFFQKVRGGLVTALYNQPEIWTLLGYEGSSVEHGGYIERGFDDINWLPA